MKQGHKPSPAEYFQATGRELPQEAAPLPQEAAPSSPASTVGELLSANEWSLKGWHPDLLALELDTNVGRRVEDLLALASELLGHLGRRKAHREGG